MASPKFEMRLGTSTRERWDEAAKTAGVPLAEFVKDCVEDKIRSTGTDWIDDDTPEAIFADTIQKRRAHGEIPPSGDLGKSDVKTFFKDGKKGRA